MSTSFADLGVPARLVAALAADGIIEPFPVQAATLPDALAGRDLCGRAPTGSGKTLAFGIPMMVRISQAEPTKPTGLVLVPTRELAEQVQRAFVPLGRAQWRFIQAIYGGASFGPQIHSLRKGCSVVVATPGRLLDIIEKGYCDLSAVEVCVVDEADRMADLGFMPDVRKILDMTPRSRQTMLFSATLDGDVNELIREYMNDPTRHDLINDEDAAPVDHRFVVTRPTERLDAAVALVEEHGPTIVFVKTRFGVDDVTEDLNRAGIKAGALHGARSQAVRQRTLDDFKRGRIQALVATDVAARGIHVDNVSLVLHYDMPDNDKDYTHRSGRTGRAGNAGLVIAFVPPSRQRIAQRMSDAVAADVTWQKGETPVERIPRGDRETGNRDRADRPSYRDRGERSDRGDRSDRPAARDRSDWTPRPPRDDNRPQYRDRNDWSPRPRRDDDRPQSRDRNDWSPRPRRDDDRSAGPGDRPARGRYGDTRPAAGGYRGPSSDRTRQDRPRDDRPPFARDGQRPPYGRDGHADRPWRKREETPSDRPRNDRPRDDRPRGDRPRDDRAPRAAGPGHKPAHKPGLKTAGHKAGFKAAGGAPSGGFRSAPGGRRRPNDR